jgi:signal transduction histidine kinase
MRLQTRFVILLAFGALLILIGALALNTFRRAERIYTDVSTIHDTYRKGVAIMDGIQSDLYVAGLLIRDFLMDPQDSAVEQYPRELLGLRASMETHLSDLLPYIGADDSAMYIRLRQAVASYWTTIDPVFEWTPGQRAQGGYRFLQRQVIPLRKDVIDLTQEIASLNAASLQNARQEITRSQQEFRRYMSILFLIALSLALLIAGTSAYHISRLERRSEQERRRIEKAERELRSLSQKLVQAQEEERKSISRELHDEVGQMLTGLRLEIRNLEELRMAPGPDFRNHAAETKELAERALRAVRNLAMGLRPSMLDDLGLGPALEWQAREFSRRNGIPATVKIDGNLAGLPDIMRTCIYRVVQESLTNCARHSKAKTVHINLHGDSDRITISVQDDGIGFDSTLPSSRGLGLIGMGERVRELGGTMFIMSEPGQGSLLDISIPLPMELVS